MDKYSEERCRTAVEMLLDRKVDLRNRHSHECSWKGTSACYAQAHAQGCNRYFHDRTRQVTNCYEGL